LPAFGLYLRPELFFDEDFFVAVLREEDFFDPVLCEDFRDVLFFAADLRPVLFLLDDFFVEDFRPDDFLLLAFFVAMLVIPPVKLEHCCTNRVASAVATTSAQTSLREEVYFLISMRGAGEWTLSAPLHQR
jgi:hypothetical protein